MIRLKGHTKFSQIWQTGIFSGLYKITENLALDKII